MFTGFKFGALFGLLWNLPHALAMAAAHGDPLLYEFQNAAWHIVEQGIGGVVVALVYGYTRRTPAS